MVRRIPVDPAILAAQTREARELIDQNDWLDALEILEELDDKGWSTPDHLRDLGMCYVKNRQRRDAEAVWIRALEQGFAPCRELLDEHCSGWNVRLERNRKNDLTRSPVDQEPAQPASSQVTQASAPMPGASPSPPTRPTPKIEVVSSPPKPRPAPSPVSAPHHLPPAQPAAQQEAPPAPAWASGTPSPQPAFAMAAQEAPSSGGGNSDGPEINWDFIMEDVRNEAG